LEKAEKLAMHRQLILAASTLLVGFAAAQTAATLPSCMSLFCDLGSILIYCVLCDLLTPSDVL
jgi:hypothetical protein